MSNLVPDPQRINNNDKGSLVRTILNGLHTIFGEAINKLNKEKADKTELENITDYNKGIFSTPHILSNSYPLSDNKKGFYAFVGSQNPFRKWEVQIDGGVWIDTEQDISIADINLTQYALKEKDGLQVVYSKDGTSIQSSIVDLEYLFAIVSKDQQVLQAIERTTGKTVFPNQKLLDKTSAENHIFSIYDSLKRIVAYIDENSLLHLPKQSLLKHTKSEGHLFNIYDTAKRVLMYLEKDGTFYFERLKLSNSTIKQIVEEIEPYLDSGANTRNICNFPTTLCRLDLIGDMTGISKKDAVLMDFKFNDYNGFVRYCKAAVTHKGSSSMAYDKKNYAFDLLDENGDSIKLKFGDWVAQDSFHLNANYIDVTHAKNITGARLTEQVYKTRIPSLQRPFNYYDSIDISDLKKRFDSGAMLHIDGFGCELYINGEYQGLYTFNLKKHRDNYQMDKSNPKHILIELADNTSISYPVPWEKWEIRNPKGFSALEEPPQGNVKTSIESFFEWCTTVTTATAKSDIESHLIVPFCLDWWLICQVIDNYDGIYKNTLWGTWDGLHWCPTLYDMDSIFGMLTDGTKIIHSPQVPLTPPDIIAKVETIYLTEIKARYSELRKQGVFTTDNIMRITTDFMLSIGIDAYKKDAKKWAEIPSNRSDGNYPNYPETGGFYESLERQRIWITGRLTFLDNYYAFTNN